MTSLHQRDDLIKNDKLAKTISVQNLTAIASMSSPITNYVCLNPDHGHQAKHLLKYWAALRIGCYYDESRKIHEMPINLIGYCTDSADSSLPAAIQ